MKNDMKNNNRFTFYCLGHTYKCSKETARATFSTALLEEHHKMLDVIVGCRDGHGVYS